MLFDLSNIPKFYTKHTQKAKSNQNQVKYQPKVNNLHTGEDSTSLVFGGTLSTFWQPFRLREDPLSSWTLKGYKRH